MTPNTYYQISHHRVSLKKKVLSTFLVQSILLDFEAEMNALEIQSLP